MLHVKLSLNLLVALNLFSSGVGLFIETSNADATQNPEELGAYFESDMLNRIFLRNGLIKKSARWKFGILPYEINGKFTNSELLMIQNAFSEYHNKTCVRFQRRTFERDCISLENKNTGCWSSVGRLGGKQEVNLQTPACLRKPGTLLHELMHALGFIHEQNRYERDDFVEILSENVRPGMLVNFVKSKPEETHGYGVSYDFGSVMHYSARSFSLDGKPTIRAKQETVVSRFMGQRESFSTGDIQKINNMYNCFRLRNNN